jgi:hypothetical protein
MHVNHMLVQCLESTMDHSLPQVELWLIWKVSCNQLVLAQNWTKSVGHGILWIIQNPWGIKRSCNYKSCSKLHLLSSKVVSNYTFFLHKFSWIFSHPLAIFFMDNLISAVIREMKNKIRRPTCQAWHWGRRQARLSALFFHLAAMPWPRPRGLHPSTRAGIRAPRPGWSEAPYLKPLLRSLIAT